VTLDFRKLVHPLLDRLGYSPAEAELLKQLRYAGGMYSEFARILTADAEIAQNILDACNEMFKGRVKEPYRSISAALPALGFVPARNFIAASIILRHPPGLVPNSPLVPAALKFALAAESKIDRSSPLAGDYFIAGLLLDAVRVFSVTDTSPEVPREVDRLLSQIWDHQEEVAKTALGLAGKLVQAPGIEKDLCLEALVHDIGKAVQVVGDTAAYLKWQERAPRLLSGLMAEEEELGMPHDALGHLVLWRTGFLRDNSWSVLYHHQPFLAARVGEVPQLRCSLIWLADHLCRYREKYPSGNISDRLQRNWFEASKAALGLEDRRTFARALAQG